MKHPSEEELADLLYDELEPARRAEIAAHVSACASCRERVESWRDVRTALRTWVLPPPRRARERPRTVSALRWAMAASVLIAVGFGLARLTAPRPIMAAADPAVVEALRAELKQDLSVQLAALHREYRVGVDRRIREIESERLAEYEGLRQDVETVALRTQEEFLRLAGAPAGGAAGAASEHSN